MLNFNYDLHMHTSLTDGKNTPEEMILSAISKGLKTVGISEHAFIPFDRESMDREKTLFYRAEMKRLKEKYLGVIDVLCGIEMDFFSQDDPAAYDYVIGSVHYIKVKDEYYGVDFSPEDTAKAIRNAFGGNPLSFASAYYELLSQVAAKTGADIIGHFDLITKFDEKSLSIAKEGGEQYYNLALWAVDDLLSVGKPAFEVNTGAISRLWRTSPYPDKIILNHLIGKNAPLVLSGDAHSAEAIAFGFDQAFQLVCQASAQDSQASQASELVSQAFDLASQASELGSQASELVSKASDLASQAPELAPEASDLGSQASELVSQALELRSKASAVISSFGYESLGFTDKLGKLRKQI